MDKSCIIIILLLVIIYGLFNQKNNKEKFEENNKQFEYPWYEGEEKINFVKDVNTRPIYLITQANAGEDAISVSSINGFRIGDKIQIISSNGNKENNLVVGIGNNILELNSKIINNHLPNTNVYNLTNPDIKNDKIKDIHTTKFYATLDSNDKLKYNNPGNPWGISNHINTSKENHHTKKSSINGDPANEKWYSCSTGGSYATYNANTLTPAQKSKAESEWPGKSASYYACVQGCKGGCIAKGDGTFKGV